MLQPVRVDAFPGLRLIDQGVPDTPGAIDLLNVEPPQRGILRRRRGYSLIGSGGSTVEGLTFSAANAAGHLIGAGGTLVTAFSTGGTTIDTQAINNGEQFSFCSVGQPGAARTFGCNGEDIFSWDGSALSLLTTAATVDGVGTNPFPVPRALASTSWDNRLMACGFADSSSGPDAIVSSDSHVYFSDEGDPNTWSADWYEQLTPGDGEKIVAACRWRDYVFVFKQTRFFVFHSTQLGTGEALFFNYFTVDTGVGAHGPGGVVAGRDGVYFLSRRGIYRTTGEDVQPIATDLDPLWTGEPCPFFSGSGMTNTSLDQAKLEMVGEKLVVSYPVGSAWRQVVSDVRFGGWSYWNLPAASICSVPLGNEDRLWFTDGADLHKQGDDETDNEVDIQAFWQGPWETFGILGEKKIRQTRLFCAGRGAVGYPSITAPPTARAPSTFRRKPICGPMVPTPTTCGATGSTRPMSGRRTAPPTTTTPGFGGRRGGRCSRRGSRTWPDRISPSNGLSII